MPVVGVCTRDLRSTRLVFKHGFWATDEVAPRRGFRQGCRLSPLGSRWHMKDLLREMEPGWRQAGCGLDLWSLGCPCMLGRRLVVIGTVAGSI